MIGCISAVMQLCLDGKAWKRLNADLSCRRLAVFSLCFVGATGASNSFKSFNVQEDCQIPLSRVFEGPFQENGLMNPWQVGPIAEAETYNWATHVEKLWKVASGDISQLSAAVVETIVWECCSSAS